jgi:hypothetical protein
MASIQKQQEGKFVNDSTGVSVILPPGKKLWWEKLQAMFTNITVRRGRLVRLNLMIFLTWESSDFWKRKTDLILIAESLFWYMHQVAFEVPCWIKSDISPLFALPRNWLRKLKSSKKPGNHFFEKDNKPDDKNLQIYWDGRPKKSEMFQNILFMWFLPWKVVKRKPTVPGILG